MAETVPPRSYVEGPFTPVREERTAVELTVRGDLPDELCGRYVRNGPNPIDPDAATQHWFTGAGMVHGVRLRDGRAERYRNRYVRTRDVTDALGEDPIPFPSTAEGSAGPVNTSVAEIGGRLLALVEAGSPPVELDEELGSVASVDLDGTLTTSFSAHPRRDPRTGRWHLVSYHWSDEALRYLVLDDAGRVAHDARVEVGDRPMVHEAPITASSVLLFDLPVTFDLDEAMGGVAFPYRWNPDRAARVGVLPLEGDAAAVRWVEVEPCYVFHSFNALDLPDGRVQLDVVRWPRVFDADRLGPSEGPTRLERWTLDPVAGAFSAELLDDRPLEFPRIDERRTGVANRHGYATRLGEPGAPHAPLLHYDLRDGRCTEVDLGPTTAVQEVLFVPRDGSSEEDDGWLLGFATDRAEGRTDLVVLAADDVAAGPVARVELPGRVPDGFHGTWVPDHGG
jgi:carotenoid cleavage dioxygenase